MDPAADLCVLQGSDSYGHIVILLHTVNIHPLVTREHANDFPLPLLLARFFKANVDTRAAGAGLGIAILVQQVVGLLGYRAEAVHQVARSVIVESREMDTSSGQLLDGGDDA